MKKSYSILIIILGAALIRLWYLSYAGTIIHLEPDSQGYYIQKSFFTDDFIHNFFNQYRTPGYKIFIDFIMHMSLSKIPLYQTLEFYHGMRFIILFQTLLGCMGLIMLFATLKRLHIPNIMNYVFVSFTALNIYQFIWDRTLLTESLYIFIFTVLIWLFVELLIVPKVNTGILFILIALYEFLIRPAGIALPYLLLPIVWIMHRSNKVFTMMVLLLAAYSIVPISYAYMNKQLYDYQGISVNSDIALFGRILRYNIPIDITQNTTPDLYQKVKNYRQLNLPVSRPWYFLVHDNNDLLVHINELKTFNSHVIINQIIPYSKSVFSDIPKMLIDTAVGDVLFLSPMKITVTDWLFSTLVLIVGCIQKATIIFFILFPCAIILFIRKRSVVNAFLLGIAFIEIYQIFSSAIYGGSWEYARHLITSQTYLFFFCFWWIGHLSSYIIRRVQHPIKKL